ncbi:MAG: hypothetical protein L6364_12465 [Desulfobulbaceae bacterium]|nr:hypothetical protein [Desulfobulbaceae bacterium]MDP2757249.1 hypothetical protein [Desulfurivibrionaceae bacterium]
MTLYFFQRPDSLETENKKTLPCFLRDMGATNSLQTRNPLFGELYRRANHCGLEHKHGTLYLFQNSPGGVADDQPGLSCSECSDRRPLPEHPGIRKMAAVIVLLNGSALILFSLEQLSFLMRFFELLSECYRQSAAPEVTGESGQKHGQQTNGKSQQQHKNQRSLETPEQELYLDRLGILQ